MSPSLLRWSVAKAVVRLVGMSSGQAPCALPQGHVLVAIVLRQLVPPVVIRRRPRCRNHRRRPPCNIRRGPCRPACIICPGCRCAPRRPQGLSSSLCASLCSLWLALLVLLVMVLVLVLDLVQCVSLDPLLPSWLVLLLLLLLQSWGYYCYATHGTSGRAPPTCGWSIATSISFRQLLALLLPLPALQQGQVASFLGIPCCLRVGTGAPRNWSAAPVPGPNGMYRCTHIPLMLLPVSLLLVRRLLALLVLLPVVVLLRLLLVLVALPVQLLCVLPSRLTTAVRVLLMLLVLLLMVSLLLILPVLLLVLLLLLILPVLVGLLLMRQLLVPMPVLMRVVRWLFSRPAVIQPGPYPPCIAALGPRCSSFPNAVRTMSIKLLLLTGPRPRSRAGGRASWALLSCATTTAAVLTRGRRALP